MELTYTEQQIVDKLESAGKPLTREELKDVKPPEHKRIGNVVDVHIKNLRRKLAGSNIEIETVRGVGYRLVKKEV